MMGDKSKFIKLEKFESCLVKFHDDKSTNICGKGSINFDGKHNTDDVLFVKGLRHNLLSVAQDIILYFKMVIVRPGKHPELRLLLE